MRAEIEIPDRLGAAALDRALEGLVEDSTQELLLERVSGEEWPTLYTSGVRYERERGTERWLTPSAILELGVGDCEDLASWRAAELRVTGEDPSARARVIRSGPRCWHAVVDRDGGTYIEDPSAILGMGSDEVGSLSGWELKCDKVPGGYQCTFMRDGSGVVGRGKLASHALQRAVGQAEVGQIPGLDILARVARGALEAALPPTPPRPGAPAAPRAAPAPMMIPGLPGGADVSTEVQRIARTISQLTSREARRKLSAAQRAVR